ncbi:MAG: hypothetical protein JOZ47_07225 [Kutzneria sp.]|nr:hypothetical protein [Kutzneria sp.]
MARRIHPLAPQFRTVLGGLGWLAESVRIGRNWDWHDAVVTLRAIIDADLKPLLPAIQAPTLAIAGERDSNCLPDYVRDMVSSIANACCATVPNKGHNGTMTSRVFVDRVREFLTDADPR